MKKIQNIFIYSCSIILTVMLSSCTNDRDSFVAAPPTDNSAQIAYDGASAVVGSQLYNDFNKTPGYDGPSDPNVNQDDISNFSDFYRCKSCHAWDLKARYASYINRGATASRPDVSAVQLVNLGDADISSLFDKIKNTGGAAVDPQRTADGREPSLGGNEHPDYGTILTDQQIWDLVKFLREGAFDTDQLYSVNLTGSYPTGTVSYTNWGQDGNAAVGQTYYNSNCAACHGANGTTIDLGGRSIGAFVREKTYEIQHKAVSGQLGSAMGPSPTTFEQMQGFLKYASDINTFPDL